MLIEKSIYRELDIIKGFAILLVILGHSFCVTPIDLYNQLPLLGDFVRSFQMPLFFVVSGFLFSIKESWVVFLKKKMLRLLLPYFVFSVVALFLKVVFLVLTNSESFNILTTILGILNGEGYWFLYSLFIVMIITKIAYSNNLNLFFAAASIMLFLFTDIFSMDILTIGRSCFYLFYFIFGLYLKSIYHWINEISLTYLFFLIVALGIFFALLFSKPISDNTLIIYYGQPIIGSSFTWLVSILLMRNCGFLARFVSHFGHFSLPYYLNHLLVIKLFYFVVAKIHLTLPILSLILIWVLAVFTSYIMLRIEMTFPPFLATSCGLLEKDTNTNKNL